MHEKKPCMKICPCLQINKLEKHEYGRTKKINNLTGISKRNQLKKEKDNGEEGEQPCKHFQREKKEEKERKIKSKWDSG